MLSAIRSDLQALANPRRAKVLSGFFKTGPGEYGEGDVFWGITVPESRAMAGKYRGAAWETIEKLLESPVHEQRLVGWLILVERFRKADPKQATAVYEFYINHRDRANSWDLVDLTADKIAGSYLMKKDKTILYALAKSKSIWDRRIAIVATLHFIRQGRFRDTLRIAEILMQDGHDLIRKAVGWMLREVGKKNLAVEERFLQKHYRTMPRTMLRYAIERFADAKKKRYMETGPRRRSQTLAYARLGDD